MTDYCESVYRITGRLGIVLFLFILLSIALMDCSASIPNLDMTVKNGKIEVHETRNPPAQGAEDEKSVSTPKVPGS